MTTHVINLQGFPLISLITLINIILLPLLIATKMVSAFADCTTFTFETDLAFNFETNNTVRIDGNGRQTIITV